MKKVKDAVKSILLKSEAATEAFYHGFLNFSAYAKFIQTEVEEETKKEVTPGNIVVALSRLNREEKGRLRKTEHEFIPQVQFDDIIVKTGLVELTFENNAETQSKLYYFFSKKVNSHDLHYIATGLNELTIITKAKYRDKVIKSTLPQKPKIILRNLACLTVRFDKNYLAIPNTIYTILRTLALNFINVIEVVSTYTEISLIVEESEMEKAFGALKKYLMC